MTRAASSPAAHAAHPAPWPARPRLQAQSARATLRAGAGCNLLGAWLLLARGDFGARGTVAVSRTSRLLLRRGLRRRWSGPHVPRCRLA